MQYDIQDKERDTFDISTEIGQLGAGETNAALMRK